MVKKGIPLLVLSVFLFIISIFYLNFLIWAALVPILFLIYSSKKMAATSYSIIFAAVCPAAIFHWVRFYDYKTYFFGVLLIASFLFLFLILSRLSIKKIKYPWNIFAVPALWLLLMFAYSFSFLDSYWANLAMFQPMLAPLIWSIGSHGITFLIVLINSMICFYLIKKDKRLIAFGSILALVLLYSFAYSSFSQPKGEPFKVALIQGNFNESWDWRISNANGTIFDAYHELTLEAAKENPAIIIWPEYSIPADIEKSEELSSKISELAKESGSYLVLGTLKWHDGYYGDRRLKNNVAKLFLPNGTFFWDYASVKPLPYEKWTLPGEKIGISEVGNIKFGITMCYEETQGHISKEYSQNGAKFLISLANNQRLKNSRGLYLSSLYSRLNAAENGKYVLRATNTGITQIVNPYGKVIAKLEPNKRGILTEEIYVEGN
ncbi:hypothetical protein HYU09_01220 [Candidatus Woesearchaeota archaeon]|nr:hypothetical protein [Candidatus Woesearchaeota archaeon]